VTIALAIAALLADWIMGLFRWLTAEHSGDAASHPRAYR
jgi:hypothetical protein